MSFNTSTLSKVNVATTITCTRPASSAGKKGLAVVVADTSSNTITMPGWTKDDQTSITGPDGQSIAFFVLDNMTGSDPMVVNTTAAQDITVIIGTWGTRATGTPTWAVTPPNTTSNSSPIAISLTGVTANAGDDIAAFVCLDSGIDTTTWSLTAFPGGYSLQNNFPSPNTWCPIALITRDNMSSGATGSLSCTATATGGTGGWSGYVVAMGSAVANNQLAWIIA